MERIKLWNFCAHWSSIQFWITINHWKGMCAGFPPIKMCFQDQKLNKNNTLHSNAARSQRNEFRNSHILELALVWDEEISLTKSLTCVSLSLTGTVMMVTHPGSWPPSLCHWKHTMFSHDTAWAGGAGGRGPDDVSTDLRMCQIPGLSFVTPLPVLASDWLMSHWSGPEPDDHTPALTAWPTVILTACCLLLPDWNKNCFHFLISSMPR